MLCVLKPLCAVQLEPAVCDRLQGKGAASQDATQTAVAISSLQGEDMLLRITKRKGYEMDDVLEEPAAQDASLWGRFTSWAKPSALAEPHLGTGNNFGCAVLQVSTACLALLCMPCLALPALPALLCLACDTATCYPAVPCPPLPCPALPCPALPA